MNHFETSSDNLYIRLIDFIYKCDKLSTDFYIAKYLINNLDQFPNITSQEVADNTYTSKGSVTKFCKKIGYKNFFEMRHAVDYPDNSNLFEVSDEKSYHDNINEFMKKSHDIDQIINKRFDFKQIERIADLLQHVKSVVIISPTFTFESANLLKEVLNQNGYNVFIINRATPFKIILEMIKEIELYIFISMTGGWLDNTDFDLLKNKKNQSIFITTDLNRSLSEHSMYFEEIVILEKNKLPRSNFISTKLYTNFFISLLYYLKLM